MEATILSHFTAIFLMSAHFAERFESQIGPYVFFPRHFHMLHSTSNAIDKKITWKLTGCTYVNVWNAEELVGRVSEMHNTLHII